VNKSKKIEVNEIIKPNIIRGVDFSTTLRSLLSLVEVNLLYFFLLRRFEKGLITINMRSKLINLKF